VKTVSDLNVVATTCPYCGVGCGVLATVDDSGHVSVRGDPDHPANQGRLCSKGAALADTVAPVDRFLHPMVRGQRVSWDEATTAVAEGLARTIAEHGPEAVAFYVSGQLLTEDYYVANKLMKGFIGAANIDTNSRLCMASSVAGHQRVFGADVVPGCYEDFEQADLLVLVGSNTAWCHPVIFQRIARAREARPELQIVVIDPRRTATCELADLHLALRPGTDVMLFDGLLDYLRRNDHFDYDFIERSTEGLGEALAAARASAPSIPAVASECGLEESDVVRFYRLFAQTAKALTVFSQGVNQSSAGTDKVNGIINCHLATGRIGRPGMGPFSITGQPNAMGGREVGGMANQLAAHMRFEDAGAVERVSRFWQAPRMAIAPGHKAVDMFEAVAAGKVRALWIMATNPAVTLPDADRFRAAMARCDLVVVSDCTHTDTTRLAHVLLPAATWGEKDGTVTNSERRISRQRPFLPAPGEARPDWWIITQVARRMGFAAQFPYERPADVFREHARLSGFENGGSRAFDIGALGDLDDVGYDCLRPVQWPVSPAAPAGTPRLFTSGRFCTPSGRARLIATAARPPAHPAGGDYPLSLNTGRIRDQWHTMTRTGRSARLTTHKPEPYVEVHPDDAREYGLPHDGLARIETRWGAMLARVSVTPEQRRGSLFVPMHWNERFAGAGRVDALVNPAVDPVSGQPELKHTPARIKPYRAVWHAFVFVRDRAERGAMGFAGTTCVGYWVRIPGPQFQRYELAGEQVPDWLPWTRGLFGADADGEWLEMADRGAGTYRAALLSQSALQACIFAAPYPRPLTGRDWIEQLFSDTKELGAGQRRRLLAGSPGSGPRTSGWTVCACFSVGDITIREAIAAQGLDSVEAIGRTLRAGTNCGSCIPELKSMLSAFAPGTNRRRSAPD